MEFLKNIKNSIYNPNFYNELLSKPFSYSLKYYFKLLTIISLVAAVFLSAFFIPAIKQVFQTSLNKIVESYPQGLEITVKDGKVSTNVPEPFFVKMPAQWKNTGDKVLENENLIVIDTKNSISVERFTSYKTMMLLTADSFIYMNEGKIVLQPISDVKNFKLDKNQVVSFIDKVKPFEKFIYPAVPFIIFIMQGFMLLSKFIYLILGALLIWLVAKYNQINIGYKKSYQLGLHLITLGIILEPILFIFKLNVFPFFFTLLLFLLTLINIKNSSNSYEVAK